MCHHTIDRMGWREKFALARKARGVKQKDLSGITGSTQGTISALEAGPSYPNLKTLIDAAEVLKIDLAWLFSDTPDHIPDDDEKMARRLFERRLQAMGSKTMIDVLDRLPQPEQPSPGPWGRDLGHVDLTQAISHEENTDRPSHPPFVRGSVAGPPTSGRPKQVELQDLPVQTDPLSSPKTKRQPRKGMA